MIVRKTTRRENKRFKLIRMENPRARLHESKAKNCSRMIDHRLVMVVEIASGLKILP